MSLGDALPQSARARYAGPMRHDAVTAAQERPPLDAPEGRPRRRFSGDEWDRIVRLGLFGPEERLELVDGEVVVMSPIGDPHSTVTGLLMEVLPAARSAGHCVRQEAPLRLGEHRLYPDVAVLRGSQDDFLRRSPAARDVALLVEVADSTVAYDLGTKATIYAAGGIPEYWVVDLPGQAVVVHQAPRRSRGVPRGWVWSSIERVARGRLTAPGCRRAIAITSFLRAP